MYQLTTAILLAAGWHDKNNVPIKFKCYQIHEVHTSQLNSLTRNKSLHHWRNHKFLFLDLNYIYRSDAICATPWCLASVQFPFLSSHLGRNRMTVEKTGNAWWGNVGARGSEKCETHVASSVCITTNASDTCELALMPKMVAFKTLWHRWTSALNRWTKFIRRGYATGKGWFVEYNSGIVYWGPILQEFTWVMLAFYWQLWWNLPPVI